MTYPTEEEVQKMINDHLEKVRSCTAETLGIESGAKDLITYVTALISHSAELMWLAKVDVDKSTELISITFKSIYEQYDEYSNGESDEETK